MPTATLLMVMEVSSRNHLPRPTLRRTEYQANITYLGLHQWNATCHPVWGDVVRLLIGVLGRSDYYGHYVPITHVRNLSRVIYHREFDIRDARKRLPVMIHVESSPRRRPRAMWKEFASPFCVNNSIWPIWVGITCKLLAYNLATWIHMGAEDFV